jgi:2-polyprenyl-3-methyl-5-hydroxy-6-metoxy-1,4-benzoquinol methylase
MATQTAYERRILRPMSTIGDKYLLGSGRSDHERLRVISEIHDGRTRELLRKAGFVAGHRFVEFGCGLGYVTRWASSEGAHATGIDLNEDNLRVATELAHEAGLKTAEFRSANIYEPGLKPDRVDVSYSRWLMVHLNKCMPNRPRPPTMSCATFAWKVPDKGLHPTHWSRIAGCIS